MIETKEIKNNLEQMESAINALCLSGHFATLSRIPRHMPDAMIVLTSDQTAEQKRRQLLQLLKEGNNEQ